MQATRVTAANMRRRRRREAAAASGGGILYEAGAEGQTRMQEAGGGDQEVHEMSMGQVLRETKVQQLVAGKGRLVEVPYTASVGDTLHSMLAHNIVAVAVAAPPGHWIGAGGSMIVESDRITGVARKQYIGIVSTLDVLFHLAELKDGAQVPLLLAGTRVSTIIGHCLQGLSLWAITPQTSVMEAMDIMSKGLHRALVPLESHMQHSTESPLESEELASSYRMLSQTDVVQFLHSKSETLHPILSRSVDALGIIQPHVFGVPANTTLVDTMKCMTQAALTAVAVLDSTHDDLRQLHQLVPAIGKRIVGNFSASDLRGCSVESFPEWAREGVLQFLRRANATKNAVTHIPLLTCYPSSTLEYVIRSALEWRVHRVWVVDEQQGLLMGLISFTDILRVVGQQIEGCAS
ncbi:hypothetical protein L7F22_001530 [Adiantum nelumboides]|nr:hypothetical protein [Adiantum nelumboides]